MRVVVVVCVAPTWALWWWAWLEGAAEAAMGGGVGVEVEEHLKRESALSPKLSEMKLMKDINFMNH